MDLTERLAAMAAETRASIVDDPHRLGESPDDVMARLNARAQQRAERWARTCPARFVKASLDGLSDQQDPGGRVSRWLDSGHTSLVLRGEESGIGKTHTAYAVAREAVDRGVWVQAWTAIDFNDVIRPSGEPAAYAAAQECDVLLIDDLGRERITDWTLERLQGVLDARWRSVRRTIITTNLAGTTLTERYGRPVVDRIIDDAVIVHVEGKPRRQAAPW